MLPISINTSASGSSLSSIPTRTESLFGRAITVVCNGGNRLVSGCSQALTRSCSCIRKVARTARYVAVTPVLLLDKAFVASVESGKKIFERIARTLGFQGGISAWAVLAALTLPPILLTAALGGGAAAAQFTQPLAIMALMSCCIAAPVRIFKAVCQYKHLMDRVAETQNPCLLQQAARKLHRESMATVTLKTRIMALAFAIPLIATAISGGLELMPATGAAGVITGCITTMVLLNTIDKAVLKRHADILESYAPLPAQQKPPHKKPPHKLV